MLDYTMLDKNGNVLKGGARWLRQIKLDGGLENHDKIVAMAAFEAFLDSNLGLAKTIVNAEANRRRQNLKVI